MSDGPSCRASCPADLATQPEGARPVVVSPRHRALAVGNGPNGPEVARGLAGGGEGDTLLGRRRAIRMAATAFHGSDPGAAVARRSDQWERLAVTGSSAPEPDGSRWHPLSFGGSQHLRDTAVVRDDTGTSEVVSAAEKLLRRGPAGHLSHLSQQHRDGCEPEVHDRVRDHPEATCLVSGGFSRRSRTRATRARSTSSGRRRVPEASSGRWQRQWRIREIGVTQ